MNQAKLTVMDFSGVYDFEGSPFDGEEGKIFLKTLPGTDGYCSDEAAEQIRSSIADHDISGIRFIDSGNYHYVTKFWLEKAAEPLTLIVFDHHTDMQPSALLPLLSCGNWILEVPEEIPVWLIGPPEADAESLGSIETGPGSTAGGPEGRETGAGSAAGTAGAGRRLHIIPEKDANALKCPDIFPENVYISIDKDVLRREDIDTDWDQGSMTADCLFRWLALIGEHCRIIGADICGEPALNDTHGKTADAFQKSGDINRKLLAVLAKYV